MAAFPYRNALFAQPSSEQYSAHLRTRGTSMLSQATPLYQPYAPIHQYVGQTGFSRNPIARLRAAGRASTSDLIRTTAWNHGKRQFPWMPHATGAVNAWALLVVPG